MKKLGFLLTLFAFFGMISFGSCKQSAEETESQEEIAPAEEETAPAGEETAPAEEMEEPEEEGEGGM